MDDKEQMVYDLTDLWMRKDGRNVTCVFLATPDEMPGICKAIHRMQKRLESRRAYWYVNVSSGCEDEGTKRYIYVGISHVRNP